jgi:hypothetical protein
MNLEVLLIGQDAQACSSMLSISLINLNLQHILAHEMSGTEVVLLFTIEDTNLGAA